MSVDGVVLWAVIGMAAGWLASTFVGGGYGAMSDIVVGLVGACLGGVLFRALHIASPFAGLTGTIFIAFIGSVVLLLLLRLVHRASGPHIRTR